MKYLKRDSTARRIRSIWRHIMLLLPPFLAAATVMFVWAKCRSMGIQFPKEDELTLTAVGVAVPAVLFSILAAMLITESYGRYKVLTSCILRHDKKEFLLYRDERFPVLLHILQIALSTPIIVIAMGLKYESSWSGGFVVFSAAFVITLYWVAIIELQNPAKSPWFAERIPKEWLIADVDALVPHPDD
jgi:hypothetical protein